MAPTCGSGNYSGLLTKIDVETNAVVASISGFGFGFYGMAFDGELLWVSEIGGHSIVGIDVKTNAILRRATAGSSPWGLAFDGRYVWVANGQSGTVSRIHTATSARLDIAVGSGPRGLAFDGRYMWVMNTASVSVTKIDSVTGYVVATISLAGSYSWGGPTCAFDRELSLGAWQRRLSDPDRRHHQQHRDHGPRRRGRFYPQGIAFDGATLWVTNFIGNGVSRVGLGGDVTSSIGVGPNPAAIAFDGSHLWTCGFASDGLVTKIPILY